MKLLQKLVWLGIALLITSCASTKPPLPEVSIPPKRILQNGYSLVPLNEKGWHIAGGNAYQLSLAKFGENPDETFTVQAMPFRLFTYKTNEEFVRLVKEGQAKDTSPPRYKILKHEVTTYPMNGTDCAKSHMVTEDHAAVKRSGKSGDMIHEMLTLTCALPSAKYVGISIIYSQRNYPGHGDPAFAEKAAGILNSVEFTEPQKIDSTSPLGKFNVLCSDILAQSPNKQPAQLSPQPIDAKQATEPNAINKLASIGISVGRTGSINIQGIYALFERDQNDDYSLIAVQPSIMAEQSGAVIFIEVG